MEIQIITIFAAIHYLSIMIFKPKSKVLGCGIFAWAGSNIKQFDKAKFDILGLYNNSRGGDSCGVTSDGEIYHGSGVNKHYGEFIVTTGYEKPTKFPVVFGHTRKSSSGGINANNIHPFGFDGDENAYEFIGVHNGTLHNATEIALTYDVEETLYEKNTFGIKSVKRHKIDSEVLLECIHRSKNFKVLSDYIGGAALVFTNTNEPNVIYAFRGASRFEKHGGPVLMDERPMYYYMVGKNDLYLSSMPESLVAIGAKPEIDMFELDENTVYKITNGNIASAEKFVLSRANAHQRAHYSYNRTVTPTVTNYRQPVTENVRMNVKARQAARKAAIAANKDLEVNIHTEPKTTYGTSPIYFNKLRYYRNGHLINGVYTFIQGYGFKFLTEDENSTIKDSESIIDKAFNLTTGEFMRGITAFTKADDVTYPFNSINGVKPPIMYFCEGVMLENSLDYIMVSSKTITYSTDSLSDMAKHPIVNINTLNKRADSQNILFKSKKYTGNISPLGSSCIYKIEDGALISVQLLPEVASEVEFKGGCSVGKQLALSIQDAKLEDQNDVIFLEAKYAEFIEKERVFYELESTPELTQEEIDALAEEVTAKEVINSTMLPIYLKMQQSITLMKPFASFDFVQEVIDSNEEFLISLDEIIEKTYN